MSGVAFGPQGATLASGSEDKTVRLWRVGRAPPLASADVERYTGATLVKGLAVAPLPRWRFAIPRLDFVAAPGFSFAPSPDPPAETNDFLVLRWSEQSPYRWLPGAEAGDAEALHRLALLREREGRRLSQARGLHQRCVATGDATWAPRSRHRLENMPWLREAAPPPASGLGLDKVLEWLKAGMPADSILHDVERDMKLQGTRFHLTPPDEQRLRDAGASAELIDQMKSGEGK